MVDSVDKTAENKKSTIEGRNSSILKTLEKKSIKKKNRENSLTTPVKQFQPKSKKEDTSAKKRKSVEMVLKSSGPKFAKKTSETKKFKINSKKI